MSTAGALRVFASDDEGRGVLWMVLETTQQSAVGPGRPSVIVSGPAPSGPGI